MPLPPPTPDVFPVRDAWKRMPRSFWTDEEAAHLLRRIGFTATPEAVEAALRREIIDTLNRAFAPRAELPKAEHLAAFEATAHARYQRLYRELEDEEAKRMLRQELQREDNRNFREFGMDWFNYARQPENSAREKFVLFLQNVFVVERQKVRETPLLHRFQQTLRDGMQLRYPDLCKQVSREPAMIQYLDLHRSTAAKPNENFARELFELFTLGEGNYTENDVKEAARAFTGYRVHERYAFIHRRNLQDRGRKTLFGQTGNWDGDDVIDLVFQQPAARTYLIRELTKFYLADTPPHEAYIEALGDLWAAHNFDLRYLINTFFQSRLFFHPAYRGNLIKSPVQFYLGLCQDLRLDVVPFEGRLFQSMNGMGQSFFDPPNVRGWLHGEHWINSTTISARRHLVMYLFNSLNERQLNGDDQQALQRAREAGHGNFLVTRERLEQVVGLAAEDLADHFTRYFITPPSRSTYRPALAELLGDTSTEAATPRIRTAVIALLQSPAYNLC